MLEGAERIDAWIKLGLTGGLGRGGRREGARPGHARCLDAVRGGLRAPVGGVPRVGARPPLEPFENGRSKLGTL